MLDEILTALAEGSLRPLPVTVFPLDGVRDAMRFMAQARHVGKIVVRVAAETGSGASSTTARRLKWRPIGSPAVSVRSAWKPHVGWFSAAPGIWCSAVAGRPALLQRRASANWSSSAPQCGSFRRTRQTGIECSSSSMRSAAVCRRCVGWCMPPAPFATRC